MLSTRFCFLVSSVLFLAASPSAADPTQKEWLNYRLYLLAGTIPQNGEWDNQRLHMQQVLREGASLNALFSIPYSIESEEHNGRSETLLNHATVKALEAILGVDGFRLLNDPSNYLKPMAFLLDRGADPNQGSSLEWVKIINNWEHLTTPLILAAKLGYEDDSFTCEVRKEMVKLLLKHDADPLLTLHPKARRHSGKHSRGTARWWLVNQVRMIRSVQQGLTQELGKKVAYTEVELQTCIKQMKEILIAAEEITRKRRQDLTTTKVKKESLSRNVNSSLSNQF